MRYFKDMKRPWKFLNETRQPTGCRTTLDYKTRKNRKTRRRISIKSRIIAKRPSWRDGP